MKIRKNTLDNFVISEQNGYLKKVSLEKDDIWLDAGANIGATAVKFSDKVNSIFCFEPENDNFELLISNTKEFNNISCFKYALIENQDKERNFFVNKKKNKGIHGFYAQRGRDKVIVKCKNINDIIRSLNINKIKMDVEGSEYELIKIMDFSNIKEFIFEFHFLYLKDIKTKEKFKEILKIVKSNFKNVNHKSLEKINNNWTTVVHCNNK